MGSYAHWCDTNKLTCHFRLYIQNQRQSIKGVHSLLFLVKIGPKTTRICWDAAFSASETFKVTCQECLECFVWINWIWYSAGLTRRLQETNRNTTTCSHFKANCCLKVHNVHLKLASERKKRRKYGMSNVQTPPATPSHSLVTSYTLNEKMWELESSQVLFTQRWSEVMSDTSPIPPH